MEEYKRDTVLVVDDDSYNLMLAQKILGKKYKMAAVKSGQMALNYLEKNIPGLILMDIKMPEMDGFETLEKIRTYDRLKTIPVIFLTADKDTETETRCFQVGAVDYVAKPFVPDILLSRVERSLELENYRRNLEDIVEQQTKMLEEKAEHISSLQEAVIVGMANLIENRDGSTGKHVKNTQSYVRMITLELMRQGMFKDQLNEDYAENIIKSAPLHDIGKIRISDNILLKPGRLTEEEFTIMKKHTIYGAQIIRDIIGSVEDEDYIKTAIEIAGGHHERIDGKGYPNGISGDDVPLSARIMSVADVFDALYEERCYKKPVRPVEKVMEILKEGKGTQFDADIVDVFVELTPIVKKFVGEA